MAFASSRIGVQEAIIKPCDLCEDEEDVNWFCVDCIQNLCERCKKGHPKIIICRNHRLVPILEGVAIQKTNASNMCQDHKEPFSFFCRTCEENICSICLSMVHKKHDFTDLPTMHSELQRTLENVIKEKEDEQMKITKNIEDLEKCTIQCRTNQTETCASIDDRLTNIHKAVDAEGDKLKNHVKITTAKQVKEVDERKQKLVGIKNEYEETIKDVKQKLTLHTTPTFGQFVKLSSSKLHSLKPLTFPITEGIRFTIGTTSQDLIGDMIGKTEVHLNARNLHDTGSCGKIRIFSELHIAQKHMLNKDIRKCYSICTSPDGNIWFVCSECVYEMSSDCSTVINCIRISVSSFLMRALELMYCPHHWRYIACSFSGDVIASASAVVKISSERKVEAFSNKSEKLPYGIAVTNHDEIVVAFAESIHAPISSLAKYSKEGRQLNLITVDEKAEVCGFCVNKNDNYVISKGRCLTTLDGNGTALKKIQISKPGLYRMRCDRYGNILGLPRKYENKSVYLISDDGDVERFFIVDCAETINDICVDRDDRLLLLADNTKVIVAEYLERK